MVRSLKDKQNSYKRVFNNEEGKRVLSDLRVFCHATKTTALKDTNGSLDPLQMMKLEGRRQVFMQIMNMLKVDYEGYYDYDYEESDY